MPSSHRRRGRYLLLQVSSAAREIGLDSDLQDLVQLFMTTFRLGEEDRAAVDDHLEGRSELTFTPEEERDFHDRHHETRDHRLYRDLLHQALADGKISPAEKKLLDRMKELLHVPEGGRKTNLLTNGGIESGAQDIIDRLTGRFGK